MNLRKLQAKRCAKLPSRGFLRKAPSETWKSKNTYCKTHDKIFGECWRMKPLRILFKNQRNVLFFTGKAEMFVSIWSLVWEKTIWNHAGNDLYENSHSQWSRRSTRAIKVIEYRYWRWIELMDRIDGSNCESNWCLKDPTQGFREKGSPFVFL